MRDIDSMPDIPVPQPVDLLQGIADGNTSGHNGNNTVTPVTSGAIYAPEVIDISDDEEYPPLVTVDGVPPTPPSSVTSQGMAATSPTVPVDIPMNPEGTNKDPRCEPVVRARSEALQHPDLPREVSVEGWELGAIIMRKVTSRVTLPDGRVYEVVEENYGPKALQAVRRVRSPGTPLQDEL